MMLASAAPSRSSAKEQKSQESRDRTPKQNSYKSPQPSSARRTPSMSPLSTSSGRQADSAMASEVIPDDLANAARTLLGDKLEEDEDTNRDGRDRSSSLSDIDGSLSDDGQGQSESDDESTGPAAEDDDSEAETERIKPTPQKPVNNAGVSIDGDLLPVPEDEGSDTESAQAGNDLRKLRKPITMAGRKRKRAVNSHIEKGSDETDSDAGVLKKRGLWQSAPPEDPMVDDDQEENEKIGEEEEEGVAITAPSSPAKDQSWKNRSGGAVVEEVQPEQDDKDNVLIEEGEEHEGHEEAEEEGLEELDPEEVSRRDEALALISSISGRFGNLKSKVHADRIAEAEAELAQLQLVHPLHTEYIRQLQAVTLRRDTKIQQEMKLLQYKKQTLRTSTLANRAQLLSQYLQDARAVREEILYDLGKQWYDIQRGRRELQADEIDGGVEIPFPTKRSTQIRQQTQYNTEVSVLAGIAKYIGFPAAPEITGAKERQLEDDLKAMQIPKRLPPPPPLADEVQPRPPAAPITTPAHLAHEEFVKQTPWANPYHPVHSQSRTPSAFGSRGPVSQATPQFSMLHRPSSAFATPQIGAEGLSSSDKRPPGSNETIGVLSDPPSSVLAAPPTVDRIRLIPFESPGDTSPLSHLKRTAGGGKRDLSGVSGTSTIDAPIDGPGALEDRASSVPFGTVSQQQLMAVGSLQGRESQL